MASLEDIMENEEAKDELFSKFFRVQFERKEFEGNFLGEVISLMLGTKFHEAPLIDYFIASMWNSAATFQNHEEKLSVEAINFMKKELEIVEIYSSSDEDLCIVLLEGSKLKDETIETIKGSQYDYLSSMRDSFIDFASGDVNCKIDDYLKSRFCKEF